MVMKLLKTSEPEARNIPAGEFKAKCLQLMDDVNAGKFSLIVTKRGKPVSYITRPPAEVKVFRSVVGSAPDIKITGDIISPLPQEWTLPEWAWEKQEKKIGKAKKKK
jgi:prevent-host-death family protein